MAKVLMISGDGHVAPCVEDARDYVDARFLDEFDAWAAGAVLRGAPSRNPEGRRAAGRAFLDADLVERMEAVLGGEGADEGEWDPVRRLEVMEARGVAAEVVFPNAVPLDGSPLKAFPSPFSVEVQWEGARAFNRWLVDFCAACPGRYAGQIALSFHDIDAAIREVEWASERGVRGAMIPGARTEDAPFWDPRYERLWSLCEERGVVVNVHGGVGSPVMPMDDVALDVRMRVFFGEAGWFSHRPLAHLIWSGVLERHPGLKVAFTEQHSDWIPPALLKLDYSWESGMVSSVGIRDVVPRRPSEYWERQCYVGASVLSRAEVEMRHEIGAEKMMFGVDFPHPEGAWLDTLGYIQATIGACDVPEHEARAMLGETAADVFGFDRDALAPVVERSGWTIDEVLTPLPSVDEAPFARTDVFRPLTYI